MARITPQHIVGLVVGEGCFYVESAPDPKYRLGWRTRPAFCIEMRLDELEILEAVQRHLECGAIYELDFGRYRGYEAKHWHPHAKYRVSRILDLEIRVVPFFSRHELFGRKRASFELFAEIVHRVYRKEHLQEEGLEFIKLLSHTLHRTNQKGVNTASDQGKRTSSRKSSRRLKSTRS